MSEPTPPPDEPMPDHVRARIREQLVGAVDASPVRAGRWAVLAAAAAPVVLVAGLTAWAVGVDDTGRSNREGQATATTPPRATDEPTPSGNPASPQPTDLVTPASPTPEEPPADDCEPELKHVLKGAEQVLVMPGEGETTSFWVRGQQFALCDARAGTVTVHQPLPLQPDLDDVATFRVSSVHSPTGQGFRTTRVAGGVVPEGAGAFDVAYTFPDGHTEIATKATDEQGRTWWRMVYAYDAAGNEMRDPPIEVSVTLSGSAFGFTLDWATDTCAQANHGC